MAVGSWERREKFLEEVNEIISGIHYKLTGGRETITISYEKNIGQMEFESVLKKEQGAGYSNEKHLSRTTQR